MKAINDHIFDVGKGGFGEMKLLFRKRGVSVTLCIRAWPSPLIPIIPLGKKYSIYAYYVNPYPHIPASPRLSLMSYL